MPRANCRARRSGASVALYSVQSWRQNDAGRWEWKPVVLRLIPLKEGMRLVESRSAHPVYTKRGRPRQMLGVMLATLQRNERNSPAMLTCSETMANAGAHDSDGFIVMTQAKVLLWPLLGDTKATAVRPRQSVAERAKALRMLTARV